MSVNKGYLRSMCASPALKVADIDFNKRSILEVIEKSVEQKVHILVFPELSITGYSCADLFYQSIFCKKAMEALLDIASYCQNHSIIVILGLPVLNNSKLYNCAGLIHGGKILGFVPKTYIPNTKEYYEARWFSSSTSNTDKFLVVEGLNIPFGSDIIFQVQNLPFCKIGIEICEDLWALSPPSTDMALSGATVIANPSASNELIGKSKYRSELVRSQSARCNFAYLYASAGPGESSTDTVFSGHSIISENGKVLSETERFKFISQTCCADIDLEKLSFERTMNSSYKTSIKNVEFRTVGFLFEGVEALSLTDASQLFTTISRTPFVPQSEEEKNHHFDEIFNIVCAGLKKRILHVGSKTAIIGISGGLDSTLALLFLNQVFNDLGYPVSNILGISMPGFGTSKRTKNNAKDLLKFLGNSYKEISIVPAVNQHFKDIGHDPKDFDITYENSQARERTQILMDVANKNGGLLIGTGDLSEMALGWCTFNGDHMSMYHVNSGIPKTLVRFLVTWISNKYYESQSKVNVVLNDIVNTPITPELLPLGKDQELVQKTEDVIGSYDLIDFILFNFLRNGYSPSKIKFLAETAFKEEFSSNYLKKYINLFFKRFFQNQFKRSSTPDGPKVGSVALSPRADWRMPSDASYEVWRL